MAVKVCFMRAVSVGEGKGLGYGSCRASETVAVPGTTTGAALAGEYVLVLSTETAAVLMAVGSAPNAAAVAETAATSAAMPLPPLTEKPVVVSAGDKLAFAAFA
jgi:hypothetical protein